MVCSSDTRLFSKAGRNSPMKPVPTGLQQFSATKCEACERIFEHRPSNYCSFSGTYGFPKSIFCEIVTKDLADTEASLTTETCITLTLQPIPPSSKQAKVKAPLILQPPYSPDVAPSTYFCSRTLRDP